MEIITLPLSSITVTTRQRKQWDQKALEELAESIRLIGLLHPIVVDTDNTLIAGFRRLKAHELLGRTHIEARRKDDLEPWELELIELEENIRREELHYADRLAAEKRLHETYVERYGKPDTLTGISTRNVWRIKDTAQLLGISTGAASQRIQLAAAMEKSPDLRTMKTETQALNELKRRESIKLRTITAMLTSKVKPPSPGTVADTTEDPLSVLEHYHQPYSTTYLAPFAKVIPHLPDASIACLITDPPWDVMFDAKFGTTEAGLQLTHDMLVMLKPKLLPDALCWMFCATRHLIKGTIASLITGCGYSLHERILLWGKPGVASESHPFTNIKNDYEPCILFSPGAKRPFSAPIFALHLMPPDKDRRHPAQKPATLVRTLIEVSTAPRELIIDPFAGSGVVLVEAMRTNRRAVGSELSREHYSGIVLAMEEASK